MIHHINMIYAGSAGTPGKKSGSVGGCGEGINVFAVDENMRTQLIQTEPADNAGIICCHQGNYIYAANEAKDFGGLNGSGGGVSAYRIEEDGRLTLLNTSLSYGSRTSYVSVSESGKYLLASNHGSHTTVTCSYEQDENGDWVLKRGFDDSSVAVFSLNDDGSIGKLTDLKVFKGSGYWCHGGGQSTAHLHCVIIRDDLVFACNRGSDEIEVLRLSEETGELEVLNRYQAEPAYAPRHAVLHPSKKILYTVNENYPSVSVYEYDMDGSLKRLQLTGTMDEQYYTEHPLPSFKKRHADQDEANTSGFGDRTAVMCSDIHITSGGRHLYVSNRRFSSSGSITVFNVNEDGTLSFSKNIPLEGKDPRGFNLSEDGQYLFVSLMDKNIIQVFLLDENGLPQEKITDIPVNSPVSLIIAEE